MQIPILIEPVDGGRFRARAGEPFLLTAEGATAEEAARGLEIRLKEQLRNGAQIAMVNIPNGLVNTNGHPPLPADDLYKTDWTYREFQEEIAAQRKLEESAEQ